eukprot:1158458-Pelagomonas_calceolata.AAC.6
MDVTAGALMGSLFVGGSGCDYEWGVLLMVLVLVLMCESSGFLQPQYCRDEVFIRRATWLCSFGGM